MKRPHGFGMIAAIVVLLILNGLAAAIVAVGSSQQMTAAQDVMSARSWQAARAGNEWGLYQALKGGWTNCVNASQTLDLREGTGFYVTVFCDSWLYNEGESTAGTAKLVRIYRIEAMACTIAACPPSLLDGGLVAAGGYVERTRVVIAAN